LTSHCRGPTSSKQCDACVPLPKEPKFESHALC
jgi:hypothetical protein